MKEKRRAPPRDAIQVLLVDDDPEDHRLIADLLDSIPSIRFLIERARGVAEGLERLRSRRFDACLFDCSLPDGDGLELLRAAGLQGQPPMIALADAPSIELDKRAMTLGAAAFLDKGQLDPASLERAIRYGAHHQRRAAALARQAFRDEATGLVGPPLFRDRLVRAVAFAERSGLQVAVMAIDLGFEADIGQRPTDAALAEAGRRLGGALRRTDTVARLADRRLALLIEGVRRSDHAALVAEKALRALEAPIRTDGGALDLKASVGVAVYPHESGDADALMRQADAAMRQAIDAGGRRYRFASARVERDAREGAVMDLALRDAIARRDLRLRFHPQIHLTSRRIGLSAEVFWRHPERDWLPLAGALADSDDAALIGGLADWTFAAAASRLLAWRAAGVERAGLSLPCLSRQPPALEILERAARDRIVATGLPAERIELDLAEPLTLSDLARGGRGLAALKATGVRLALDGFGQGDATLQDLRQDLLDGLKLSAGLYDSLPGDGRRETLVRAIVGLGHDLDLYVTANGARDNSQFALLKRLGCDAIQLRAACPPMSAAAAESWLRQMQAAPEATNRLERRAGGPEALAPPPEAIARGASQGAPSLKPN